MTLKKIAIQLMFWLPENPVEKDCGPFQWCLQGLAGPQTTHTGSVCEVAFCFGSICSSVSGSAMNRIELHFPLVYIPSHHPKLPCFTLAP